MNQDEEGGIAGGSADSIEYYYEKITKEMDNVIDGLNKLLKNHSKNALYKAEKEQKNDRFQ